ncbi:MAG: hypothetical protein NT118_01280 [Lentisphaerae bacterium]|nr:hypothetical protein [Lentisphaerota bacterium]
MKNKSLPTVAFPLALVFLGLAFSVFSADYMNRNFKEIELSKPSYLKRTSAQWERQGRIIGEVKNTPKTFSIQICVPGSNPVKVLKTETFNDNLTVYETGWLGAGTYDIICKSEGYIDQAVRNVTVKPCSDCVIDIVFGTVEYRKW